MNRPPQRVDEASDMVPRFSAQGYRRPFVDQRREWVEQRTQSQLKHVGSFSIDSESTRGNIENPIGAAQVPLGIAGPLLVRGEHADGAFYVPLATSEGALVRSYERGMVAITRAGGAVARVTVDENRASPIFTCEDVAAAHDLTDFLRVSFPQIKALADATTNHGKLLRVNSRLLGRDVLADFCFQTGDAHGMNMIAKATDVACRWITRQFAVENWYVMSGASSEKRPSGILFTGGKGKHVTAGVRLSKRLTRRYLHTTPGQLAEMWRRTNIGQTFNASLGYNGHFANGLTALFIACGQDVANVVNSAVGLTNIEESKDGDVYVSVTLPSLVVATVGGGTGVGTGAECLAMLGCHGSGQAAKLAEITAATILAGELSFGAALASGEFVSAHEEYGRNRPTDTVALSEPE